MPRGLKRFQASGHSHFVTFSCFRRRPYLASSVASEVFVVCLERMRVRFSLRIYGYVVMPEHVHLLLSEPDRKTLADAIHFLKLSHAKLMRSRRKCGEGAPFWQKRYHDRNVRNYAEFAAKLRYLHRNPVQRGLVEKAEDWPWSSFRHYALHEPGPVAIESEWVARMRDNTIPTLSAAR